MESVIELAPSPLTALPVGARVWFTEERRPYTVQARSERYLVCTKPFAAQHTVLYTIVDLQLDMRGPENLTFGFGAETQKQCDAMIARLTHPDDPTEISRRRSIDLNVARTWFLTPLTKKEK
jgi:hypothetical protein